MNFAQQKNKASPRQTACSSPGCRTTRHEPTSIGAYWTARACWSFKAAQAYKNDWAEDVDSVFQEESVFHQQVYLLAKREYVKKALTEPDKFSSSPYRALGSGTFMLGLDGETHEAQRAFASKYLRYDAPVIDALARVAFDAAAVLPSKQRNFDLVELSEQVALRFAGFLFGFEEVDIALLDKTMRAAYVGANYQIMGRHFVSEPGAVLGATVALGALLQRVAQLIDLYRARIGQAEDDEFARIGLELAELRQEMGKSIGSPPLTEFEPVLKRIANGTFSGKTGNYSGNELAVIVVGLIAGSIGNIQAGASIAIYQFFAIAPANDAGARCCRPVAAEWNRRPLQHLDLGGFAAESPGPIPAPQDEARDLSRFDLYSERQQCHPGHRCGHPRQGNADSLIFGGPEGTSEYLHQCLGQHLAMPVIARVVMEVLMLDGLAETFDPRTGKLLRLEKFWGVHCKKYPLEFNRTDVLTQFPLSWS